DGAAPLQATMTNPTGFSLYCAIVHTLYVTLAGLPQLVGFQASFTLIQPDGTWPAHTDSVSAISASLRDLLPAYTYDACAKSANHNGAPARMLRTAALISVICRTREQNIPMHTIIDCEE